MKDSSVKIGAKCLVKVVKYIDQIDQTDQIVIILFFISLIFYIHLATTIILGLVWWQSGVKSFHKWCLDLFIYFYSKIIIQSYVIF